MAETGRQRLAMNHHAPPCLALVEVGLTIPKPSGGGKLGDGCVEEGLEISYQGGQGSKLLGTRGKIVVWFIAAVVSVLRSTM